MSPLPSAEYLLFIGIDVASKSAQVRWLTATGVSAEGMSIAQTPDGHTALCAQLLKLCPQPSQVHVTIEATGSLYVHLAHALHAAGFAVSVINALRVRRFAETWLQLDKTDDLDALIMARFGLAIRPALWTPPSEIYETLFQLIIQRRNLVRMHAQTVNRQHALKQRIHTVAGVETRQDALHKFIKAQIHQIEREIAKTIKADPAWQATLTHITSIPGVGLSTAAWLMMLTHNFTTCQNAKQLAAYIGLIPRRRQSGSTLNTYRSVGHVGQDDARQHLYNATLCCLRYNPRIRAYYDHIKHKRHKHKIAAVAATHKLLDIIFAVATSDQDYDPDYTAHARDEVASLGGA